MSAQKDLRTLTALKGIFCLLIAFHNTLLVQPLFENIPGVAYVRLFGGTMGNSAFLMISGFLFAYNYRGRIQSHQVSFPVFLTKRLRRLYPLYLLSNGVSLVISIVMYGPSVINLKRIASILLLQTFDPYNAPTWFLTALFACYLLFYFICYHSKNSTQYYCAIAICVMLAFSLQTELPFLGFRYCFAYLNFFTGCILAEVYPVLQKKAGRWLPHICLAVLGCIGFLFLKYGVEIISGTVEHGFSLFVSPLILCIALSDSIYAKVLQIKPLLFLGKISTSVYFWHLPLFYTFTEVLVKGPVSETQYLIYAAALCVCAIASNRFLENRGKQKKDSEATAG